MVLEARYKAEKIWYPVIWETQKESSDVVDYDIHDEITVNTSSVFNANNDTTTGMATVIPWVNAPKLIQSTSIYGDVVNKTATWKVSWSGSVTIDQWDTKTWLVRPLTISSQSWAYTYKIWNYFNWNTEVTNAAIIIPEAWVYLLEITYQSTVNVFFRRYDVMQNLKTIATLRNDTYYSETWSAYPTESLYINAKKNDQIAFYYIVQCTWWGTWNVVPYSVSTKITKL